MIDVITSAVIAALMAGTNEGLKEVTKKGISDGYEQLKALLLRHGHGEHDVADALKKLEGKPDSEARKAVLVEELESSGAAQDLAIQNQARLLLNLIKELPAGNTSGQIASGTGIAQADRGSSATVNITTHQG
ncbi:MAG TPA: hypothetical protein VFB43_10710 [Terracidiphilus sp.]|nr:hypothetical protein [Terracidiphilus sp.]